MLVCPRCGAQNMDGASACSNCGVQFTATPVQGYTPVSTNQPGKGFAIAGMVCGIVSFFCFGFILGLLAIIFGAVAKNKGYQGGMATSGVVLGCIALALYVVCLVFLGSMGFFESMNMFGF